MAVGLPFLRTLVLNHANAKHGALVIYRYAAVGAVFRVLVIVGQR